MTTPPACPPVPLPEGVVPVEPDGGGQSKQYASVVQPEAKVATPPAVTAATSAAPSARMTATRLIEPPRRRPRGLFVYAVARRASARRRATWPRTGANRR